jgi:superfamily II DNA or RNA helicase/HKD family nuclease
MLQEGLYETLLNNSLKLKLAELPVSQFYIEKKELDTAEASKLLAGYVAKLIQFALSELKEENPAKQIVFCNKLLLFIQDELKLDFSQDLIALEGQVLAAILSKIGKTESQLKNELVRKLPQSGLLVSNLFTGSNADLSIDTEIEKDILSADNIYWIVSFIRWSGLRIFDKVLKEFTSRENASLKIITTTYMGATEVEALNFLSKLPNTEIKISYQTNIERLHAKAYIFERNSGFDTAFIGSSNLSKSALTKGLEWNMRITAHENSHIINKAKATFDHYWNSIDFEDFRIGGIEKFKEALKVEKYRRDAGNQVFINSYFTINPLPFQKEILDILKTERELHFRFKNLVVAATGTGKTVISAFDWKRYYEANKGNAKLLFIAHRKEILEQALGTFRAVLGAGYNDFGQLWVGNHKPIGGDLKHLFVSIQTLNSQKELFTNSIPKDYYDFIIVDEAHHSQADSYRFVFDYFTPKLLVGLTATPERMDGQSLLPDFDNKIAAEIRLPDALSLKLLTPFHYFCISDDSVDLRTVKWSAGKYDVAELTQALTNKKRIKLITDAIEYYLSNPLTAKAICFCASKEHAKWVSDSFNTAGLKATYLVSGGGYESEEERKQIRLKLLKGEINYICVVDIFNEGIDIPEIDTVLFLRPTESLTIFLQQLGRGLRLSDDKECLTVLDFVSQAHASYNFANKFRALVKKGSTNLKKEVEDSFPHLPAGCSIRMEKQAQQYILENISNTIFNAQRITKELRLFTSQTHLEPTLLNFLHYFELDIRTIYKSKNWSAFKKEAGLISYEEKRWDKEIASGLKRVIHTDSKTYIQFIKQLINTDFSISIAMRGDEKLQKLALMFYYDIWQKGIGEYGFESIYEGIAEIGRHEVLKKELEEITEYLFENLNHTTKEIDFAFPNILELHARYSRDQILCAFNKTTPERSFPSQEGVVKISDLHTELLLVTLNKSDKDFSPSTQYHDYAVSEKIFHWQSQNAASPETPVGLSYINHHSNGKKHLLFVREARKDGFGFTSPYHFLGAVDYISHKGAKPMSITWELQEPMPPKVWEAAGKMA